MTIERARQVLTRLQRANDVALPGEGAQFDPGPRRRSRRAQRESPGQDRRVSPPARISTVAGDASAAYQGRLKRSVRPRLFLRPALLAVLGELETPEPAEFPWLLHAFEQMETDEEQRLVAVYRAGATLSVRLACEAGLAFPKAIGSTRRTRRASRQSIGSRSPTSGTSRPALRSA